MDKVKMSGQFARGYHRHVMKRKVFALWLLCYMFLLWPMVKKSYNNSHSWPFQRSIIVQIAACFVDRESE